MMRGLSRPTNPRLRGPPFAAGASRDLSSTVCSRERARRDVRYCPPCRYVVAALHAKKGPPVRLKDLAEILAGDGLHTTISMMRSRPVVVGGWTETERQPSTAS